MSPPRWGWFDKASAALTGTLAAFVVGLAAVGGWHVLFPPARWYELASVRVNDTFIGQDVTLTPARTIHRDFRGSYTVTVFRVGPDDRWTQVCTGGLSVPYRTNSALPVPVTLDWWTAGAEPPCQEALGVGRFVLETCVNVGPFSLPWRDVCPLSGVFKVKPRGL